MFAALALPPDLLLLTLLQQATHVYCFLPADERSLAGHRFLRPFLRRSFSTRRPVLLCMRVRKPEVRRRALQQEAWQADMPQEGQ